MESEVRSAEVGTNGKQGPRGLEVMCERHGRSVSSVHADEWAEAHQKHTQSDEYYVLIELYGPGRV